jgi:hypothetical protein
VTAVWAVVVPLAGPAGADPPRPSDYRSTVTGVTPATDAVELSVIGGDAFLRLRVEPGHEALVLGYQDEPYLRFRADGTVQENLNSPATYTNSDRYGDVALPQDVDPEAPPDWRTLADDGGSYSWHDHRIHWMSSQPPADVPRGSEVQRWEVHLVVDDEPVTVRGVLALAPAAAWWPWVVAIAGLAGLVWGLGRLTAARAVPTVAAGAACLLTAGVAGAEQLSIPAEAGRSGVVVAVPSLGVLCALAAGVLTRRRIGNALGLAAAALAGGSAALRSAVFTKPVLPTDLAPSLDRAATAGALGLAIAAAALLVVASRRPGPVEPQSVSHPGGDG